MSHPGRMPTIITSPPQKTHSECIEEVMGTGLELALKHYAPSGWIIEDTYCIPVTEGDSLKGLGDKI